MRRSESRLGIENLVSYSVRDTFLHRCTRLSEGARSNIQKVNFTLNAKFKKQFSRKQKDSIDNILDVAPWLVDCKFKDAVITIDDDSIVWHSGIWLSGTWIDGEWNDGDWIDGIWLDGIWNDGFWKSGIWKNGTWEKGLWLSGSWKKVGGGIWEDGCWLSGYWDGGIWEYGVWDVGIIDDKKSLIHP